MGLEPLGLKFREGPGLAPYSTRYLAFCWLALRTLTFWVSTLTIIRRLKVELLGGVQKSAKHSSLMLVLMSGLDSHKNSGSSDRAIVWVRVRPISVRASVLINRRKAIVRVYTSSRCFSKSNNNGDSNSNNTRKYHWQ